MNIKNILVAVLAVVFATGCNGQETKTHGRASQQDNKSLNSENMKKSIVIFFSHAGDNYSVGVIDTGNTKIVADYISEITGADQFEIVTHKY
ncbi:MAG: flavodoxin, partial [Bacteroidales bacterium]|nr:flavodoxin [Bacteroidales bacterium]